MLSLPDHAIKPVYDVFLSYSRRNRGVALAVVEMLKAAGHRVWWDHDIRSGQLWRATLPIRIEQSRRVVVLWSPEAVKSKYVEQEVVQAGFTGKLLAFRVAPCDVPHPFSEIQAPKLGWSEDESGLAVLDEAARELILTQLGQALREAQAPVAVAGVKVKLPPVLSGSTAFFGRDYELTLLHRAWDSADSFDSARKTNVVAITAMGGAGKTALLQKFRDELARRGYAGATRVYGWSAYSQGSHENRQTSSEIFIEQALADFGHDLAAEPLATARLKAERLAALMQRERALVILDGLEPLQHPQKVQAGRFKDEGLDVLVTALAAHNAGLLLLTSRQHFTELGEGSPPRVILHDLEALDEPAAIALLEDRGVIGPRTLPEGPDRAVNSRPRCLADLARSASRHALTLNLLGTYTQLTFGGDLRQLDTVNLAIILDELAEIERRADDKQPKSALKAQALMRQFETRFVALDSAGGGQAELAVLRILGLFDRPAEAEVVNLLREAAIPGLTADLAALPPRRRGQQWRYALERLRDMKLVLPPDPAHPGALDAHPLVREHFGRQLREQAPETWQLANERLYEHYRWQGVPEQYRNVNYAAVLQVLQWLPDELPPERPGETRDAYVARLMGPFRERMVGEAAGSAEAALRRAAPAELRDAPADRVREAAVEAAVGHFSGRVTELLLQIPPTVLMALFPPTLPRMTPLLWAIGHGCMAGRHEEVRAFVYRDRVLRGPAAFINSKLGATAADLAALSAFFDEPWTTPAAGLSPPAKAWLLSLSAFALRALGRLREAVPPFRAGKNMSVAQRDWGNAASGALNLSELFLVLGDVEDAIAAAREAQTFAERMAVGQAARDSREFSFSTLGAALTAAGELVEAGRAFEAAERSQAEAQPGTPRLYAIQGYSFSDLGLAQGRATEALSRGKLAEQWTTQATEASQLSVAAFHLTLGRAHAALEHVEPVVDHATRARHHLDAAVEHLRRYGQESFIAQGLLARADFHIRHHDLAAAQKDLTEALSIANRGEMRLWMTDAMLGFARLSLAAAHEPSCRDGALTAARACWREAVTLIDATGYKRRLPEASLIEAEIARAEGDDETATVALETATAAALHQQQFGLRPDIEALAAGLPLLVPALTRFAEAHAAFDREADARWDEHERFVEEVRRRPVADDAPTQDGEQRAAKMAKAVDALLADPEARAAIEGMLADGDFRAALAAHLEKAGLPVPLDALPPDMQLKLATMFVMRAQQTGSA